MQDSSRNAAQGKPDVKARRIFLTEPKPDEDESMDELKKCKPHITFCFVNQYDKTCSMSLLEKQVCQVMQEMYLKQ